MLTSIRFFKIIFQPRDLHLLLWKWQPLLLISRWHCHVRGWVCLLPLGASADLHRERTICHNAVFLSQLLDQNRPMIVHRWAGEKKYTCLPQAILATSKTIQAHHLPMMTEGPIY